MAKQTGGLLAFNSSGSIAKTLVYSRWRGRQYTRQHVIPKNPRSTAQVATRNIFTWLTQAWKPMPDAAQFTWTTAADGRPLTDRNLFVKMNLSNLSAGTDLSMLQMVTSAKGGSPPTMVVLTSGTAGHLTATWVNPTIPDGYTAVEWGLIALIDQDPHTDTNYTWQFASSNTIVTTLSITGLTTGDTYTAQVFVTATDDTGNKYKMGVSLPQQITIS